jgi:hypothetical protein
MTFFSYTANIKLKDRQKFSSFILQTTPSEMVLNQSGFSTVPLGIKKRLSIVEQYLGAVYSGNHTT